MSHVLPDEVQALRAILNQRGVWHSISPNGPGQPKKVWSCKEAAFNRNRLGHTGIPLCDELKSDFRRIEGSNGRTYAMVHCRAHHSLDESALDQVLEGRSSRATGEELSMQLDRRYGLVNPFFGFRGTVIRQVFDESVLHPPTATTTMFTNADHARWGVEFDPVELVEVLPGAEVAPLVKVENHPRLPRAYSIGILTGNSPESGMLLWQMMNGMIRDRLKVLFHDNVFLGDVGFPHVMVESVPGMGLSMELAQRLPAVERVIAEGVSRLCQAGASHVAIACNTTQHFSRVVSEICGPRGVRHVTMAEAIRAHLHQRGIGSFDFLGLSYAADFDGLSGFASLRDEFEVHVPSHTDLRRIADLAFEVKQDVVTSKAQQELIQLMRDSTRTNTVVIALTELSIVLAAQKNWKSTRTLVDTLQVQAASIADEYVNSFRWACGAPIDPDGTPPTKHTA